MPKFIYNFAGQTQRNDVQFNNTAAIAVTHSSLHSGLKSYCSERSAAAAAAAAFEKQRSVRCIHRQAGRQCSGCTAARARQRLSATTVHCLQLCHNQPLQQGSSSDEKFLRIAQNGVYLLDWRRQLMLSFQLSLHIRLACRITNTTHKVRQNVRAPSCCST